MQDTPCKHNGNTKKADADSFVAKGVQRTPFRCGGVWEIENTKHMQHDVSNKKSAQTGWVGFTYLATSGDTGFVLSY
ncbi:MAG: hypothetical protein DPW16_08705 [Chloroflexi bacterium]|nr:hypothetical protein [Chloroflexota bacterium]